MYEYMYVYICYDTRYVCMPVRKGKKRKTVEATAGRGVGDHQQHQPEDGSQDQDQPRADRDRDQGRGRGVNDDGRRRAADARECSERGGRGRSGEDAATRRNATRCHALGRTADAGCRWVVVPATLDKHTWTLDMDGGRWMVAAGWWPLRAMSRGDHTLVARNG